MIHPVGKIMIGMNVIAPRSLIDQAKPVLRLCMAGLCKRGPDGDSVSDAVRFCGDKPRGIGLAALWVWRVGMGHRRRGRQHEDSAEPGTRLGMKRLFLAGLHMAGMTLANETGICLLKHHLCPCSDGSETGGTVGAVQEKARQQRPKN